MAKIDKFVKFVKTRSSAGHITWLLMLQVAVPARSINRRSSEETHRLINERDLVCFLRIQIDRGTFLKRALAMELVELDELQQAFREKALVDRDTSAGVLLIKVAERRATLLGLNPPIGHAVQVIHEPQEKTTSTERIHASLDRIASAAKTDEPEDAESPKPH